MAARHGLWTIRWDGFAIIPTPVPRKIILVMEALKSPKEPAVARGAVENPRRRRETK